MNTNVEIILKDKVKNLGEYLISICNDESKKQDIRESLIGLPTYKILLFISFLDLDKIDHQISDFVTLFKLNDTNENRIEIKKYIDYFIDIKKILNE